MLSWQQHAQSLGLLPQYEAVEAIFVKIGP